VHLGLKDVCQSYGRRQVLNNINLNLASGIVGLLGPNGAGKTTLLRTMATIMPPTSGKISVNDIAIENDRSARRARTRIGYLPQSFGYEPGMRIIDFVHYAAWMRDISASDRDRAVARAIGQVELDELSRTKMKRLSGGMRQRAGIAWA
jgi:ABC-2 type transport system ATP-binding protein